jgi:hypothetical protein
LHNPNRKQSRVDKNIKAEMTARHRIASSLLMLIVLYASQKAVSADQPIIDDELRIMWLRSVSPSMMPWSSAAGFCKYHRFVNKDDWRLPTEKELGSMVNPGLVDSGQSERSPLYGPFAQPSIGYLFSGTTVNGAPDSPWVMNLRNGHIFNGKGYSAYVRCVRDSRFR